MTLERMQILITMEQRAWLERESAVRSQPCTAIIRDAIDAARGVRPVAQRRAALAGLAALAPGPALTLAAMDAALESRYRAVPE